MSLRLERAATAKLADQILIYGAGNTGKSVCAHLAKLGVNVVAFVDQNKRGRSDFCERPLFSLDDIEPSLRSKQIVIAIHNREVDLVGVMDTLRSKGFSDLLTMVDYANANPSDKTFRYFLSPAQDILAQEDQIRKFEKLLSDEKSKSLYQQLLLFRLGHGYDCCPMPEVEAQYVPSDLKRWVNPMRLIDCGAYDGDSIEIYQKAEYKVDELVAFEPDLNNYTKLVANCQEISAICLPCGVGATAGVLRFDAGGGEGSRVSDSGETVIQICSIDETLGHWAPTLIKMDIESAEFDAINGAKNTITKYRPGLAISAYHTPDDLWRLGLLINELAPDYDFHLRCHAYSSFDTVLYAFPR